MSEAIEAGENIRMIVTSRAKGKGRLPEIRQKESGVIEGGARDESAFFWSPQKVAKSQDTRNEQANNNRTTPQYQARRYWHNRGDWTWKGYRVKGVDFPSGRIGVKRASIRFNGGTIKPGEETWPDANRGGGVQRRFELSGGQKKENRDSGKIQP